MKKNIFFIVVILLYSSCTHRPVKLTEDVIIHDDEVVESNLDEKVIEDMKVIYEKLIYFIKKRDLQGVLSCYLPFADFSYSSSEHVELRCYDGSFLITGTNEIEKQYLHIFQKRYLNNFEYEIINSDSNKKMLKIINLWQNSDFGVFEYLYFAYENQEFGIVDHRIIKEHKGARG